MALPDSFVAVDCEGVQATGPGVWYNITGGDEVLRASTCVDNTTTGLLDTKISVYTGTCGSLECVAANDDFCGQQSSVSWLARKGQTYFIYVHGDASGSFSLTVGYETNGLCDTSIPIVSLDSVVVGSTRATDRTLTLLFTCDFVPATDGTIWYSIVGTGSWMQASTCHDDITEFDARLNEIGRAHV